VGDALLFLGKLAIAACCGLAAFGMANLQYYNDAVVGRPGCCASKCMTTPPFVHRALKINDVDLPEGVHDRGPSARLPAWAGLLRASTSYAKKSPHVAWIWA
jgi:hypothetical protein